MRIGLDARTIFSPQWRGTGKTLVELYRQVAILRPQWEVVAFHRQKQVSGMAITGLMQEQVTGGQDSGEAEGFFRPCYMEMPGDRWRMWERVGLPVGAWRRAVDVLHCPANGAPWWWGGPVLTTVHDLIPLEEPQYYEAEVVKAFERGVKSACRRGRWVMCPSEYTRGRLMARFGADGERVIVNPWAGNTQIRPWGKKEIGRVMEKMGLRGPMVLHFGASDLRKNTRRLLDAWAMLDRELRSQWTLVIVGLDEKSRMNFREIIDRHQIGLSVYMAGFVAEEDLAGLMQGAQVLAYPSLSEGFGLPVLDAFASGTAVLAGNVTSVPEVAGEAAVLVDPLDTCAMVRGLSKIMREGRFRQALVEAGKKRLQGYSWQATGERFVQLLEKIHEEKGRGASKKTMRKDPKTNTQTNKKIACDKAAA